MRDAIRVVGGFLILIGAIGFISVSHFYLGIGGEESYLSNWEHWSNWRRLSVIFQIFYPLAFIASGVILVRISNPLERISRELKGVSQHAERRTTGKGHQPRKSVDYCPNCGQEVSPGAEFCPSCGEELE